MSEETKPVVNYGLLFHIRAGKDMDPQIAANLALAKKKAQDFSEDSNLFNWSYGDFTNGLLTYVDAGPGKQPDAPIQESLLYFAMSPSAGRAIGLRANGEIIEWDIVLQPRKPVG
jgi:hypothetical protein